jgi:hypothetical protein
MPNSSNDIPRPDIDSQMKADGLPRRYATQF